MVLRRSNFRANSKPRENCQGHVYERMSEFGTLHICRFSSSRNALESELRENFRTWNSGGFLLLLLFFIICLTQCIYFFVILEMAEGQRYKDKVTIVTGGTKGIGRGCVDVFCNYVSLKFVSNFR